MGSRRVSTMRTVRGATGLKVHCVDCGWDEEETADEKGMRALSGRARYHAGKENHRVHVWRETLFVYESSRGRRRSLPTQNAPSDD